MFLAGVLFVGVAIFRQPIGRIVLRRALVLLGRELNGEVVCEEISGDIISHPRLIGLKILLASDSVVIKELRFRYDPLALVRGRMVLRDVFITEPRFYLSGKRGDKRGDQRMAMPGFPRFTVRTFVVENGMVSWNGTPRVDSIGVSLRLRSVPERLELFIDSARGRLVQESLRISQFAAGVKVTGDSLFVQDLVVMTDASRFRGGLVLEFDSGGVAAQVSELSVSLKELVGIDGRVWFKGTAETKDTRRTADGNWVADGLSWQRLLLPRITGKFQLRDSVLHLSLSGSDTVLGRFFIQGQMDLIRYRFSARADVDSLAVYRLEKNLPLFHLSAEILLNGVFGSLGKAVTSSQWDGHSDSVEIEIRGWARDIGVDTIFAQVNYSGGRAQLRGLTLRGPAGNFDFIGVARQGLIRARCEMNNFDLAVGSRFLNKDLQGRADGVLEVERAGETWAVSGLVRVDGFNGFGVEITNGLIQLDLKGEFKPERLSSFVGRVAVGGEGVRAAGQEWNAAQFVWTGPEFDLRFEDELRRLMVMGDIVFDPEGMACVVRTMEFVIEAETVALADSCEIFWRGDLLTIKGVKVRVADGELQLDLAVCPNESPRLIGTVRGLNLRKLQKLVGLNTELWGVVDIDIAGKDTLIMNFTGVDFALPASDINLKYLGGRIAFSREGAVLEEVAFVHHRDTSTIRGRITWEWDKSFAITGVTLNSSLLDPGVWIFSVARPYVDIKEGTVYGMVAVNWHPGELRFSGRGRVSNGLLFVSSIATTVDRVQAELTFSGEKVVLEKLSGRSAKGTVTAEGFVKLNPEWQVESLEYNTNFSGVSAVPMTSVYAIGNGNIKIGWAEGMKQVLISGTVDVSEALIAIGFGNGGGNGSTGSVDYDIRVRGERGIWLRNRDADIELGADLTFRQVNEEAVYTGELVVRQGSIYYLDHILRVVKGRLIFDNVNRFTPQLDIRAELPVVRNQNNAPEKIVLTLTGNLEEPSFTFSSEPPVWDETQVLSYLSLNVTMEEISALEQKELVNRLLSERLLGYFQTQVAKRMREFVSLDYLELETGILAGQGARVTVGKYIGRNLYVSYTQNFTGELQPGFLIEYYFNRRNELLAERSTDGRYALRYRFKIRY